MYNIIHQGPCLWDTDIKNNSDWKTHKQSLTKTNNYPLADISIQSNLQYTYKYKALEKTCEVEPLTFQLPV